MGTKLNPGSFDCYEKAADDEPMFVLLARDRDAANLVRTWAGIRLSRIVNGEVPEEDIAMVREARKCADDMDAWHKEHKNAE